MSQQAVAEMLAEQEIDAAAEAVLNLLEFTTPLDTLADMLATVTQETDAEFERLVASLVQDSGRSAESVSTTVRPNIWHVRHLSPPSCSRCAVLAGRVYRYSEGFQRHPNCDCVMVPTTVSAPGLIEDPVDLMRQGLVTGLSKADQQAIADGADFGQVVNVRRRAAGLRESGHTLARAGRPTPEGIYRITSDRAQAVELLRRYRYIT
jgi:ribosomal protein L18E